MSEFKSLQNKKIVLISGCTSKSKFIQIICSDHSIYNMQSNKKCCPFGKTKKIIGNLNHLIDAKIIFAEKKECYRETIFKITTKKDSIYIYWEAFNLPHHNTIDIDFWEINPKKQCYRCKKWVRSNEYDGSIKKHLCLPISREIN